MSQTNASGGAPAAPGKHCVLCRADVAGKPRVKDPAGRYYCKPCHDTAIAESHASESHVGNGRVDSRRESHSNDADPDFAGLARMTAAATPAEPTAAAACPSCHAILLPNAVLCTNCGCDLRTGKNRKTRVERSRTATSLGGGGGGGGTGIGGTLGAFASWPLVMGGGGLLAYLVAVAASLGTIPDRIGGLNSRWASAQGWGTLLVAFLIGATLGGAIYWLVAPLWFRLRLRMAGAEDVEAGSARGVYFATVAPSAAWTLLYTVCVIAAFSSPAEFASPDRPISVLFDVLFPLGGVGLLILGCVPLYFASRNTFGARPIPAALLLIVLPVLWYLGSIALLATAAAWAEFPNAPTSGSGVVAAASGGPNLTVRREFEAEAAAPHSFSYPGNWSVMRRGLAEGERYHAVEVDGLDGSSIWMSLLESQEGEERILEQFQSDLREAGIALAPLATIDQLGRLKGKGRTFLASQGRAKARMTFFVHRVRPRLFFGAMISVPEPDDSNGQTGVDLVFDTLTISP